METNFTNCIDPLLQAGRNIKKIMSDTGTYISLKPTKNLKIREFIIQGKDGQVLRAKTQLKKVLEGSYSR